MNCPLVAGSASCPGDLRAGLLFLRCLHIISTINHVMFGCIINACLFSLQIYVSIIAQIKRLSFNQHVNERDTPHFQGPVALSRTTLQGLLILKEKLQLPVMKVMMIMGGNEGGGAKGRKWCRDKAAPVSVAPMPI